MLSRDGNGGGLTHVSPVLKIRLPPLTGSASGTAASGSGVGTGVPVDLLPLPPIPLQFPHAARPSSSSSEFGPPVLLTSSGLTLIDVDVKDSKHPSEETASWLLDDGVQVPEDSQASGTASGDIPLAGAIRDELSQLPEDGGDGSLDVVQELISPGSSGRVERRLRTRPLEVVLHSQSSAFTEYRSVGELASSTGSSTSGYPTTMLIPSNGGFRLDPSAYPWLLGLPLHRSFNREYSPAGTTDVSADFPGRVSDSPSPAPVVDSPGPFPPDSPAPSPTLSAVDLPDMDAQGPFADGEADVGPQEDLPSSSGAHQDSRPSAESPSVPPPSASFDDLAHIDITCAAQEDPTSSASTPRNSASASDSDAAPMPSVRSNDLTCTDVACRELQSILVCRSQVARHLGQLSARLQVLVALPYMDSRPCT